MEVVQRLGSHSRQPRPSKSSGLFPLRHVSQTYLAVCCSLESQSKAFLPLLTQDFKTHL